MNKYTLLRKLVDVTLKYPKIFEWQQKVCNHYENIQKEFLQFYSKKNQYILDIGCSTGTCAGKIVDMKNNHYFGIDISQEYIQRASKLYPQGTFLQMDATKLHFPNTEFDFALFNGVLHHMDDTLIENCLKSLKTVLKKGGHILVSEPVFTKGKHLSTFLLSLDRGRYIRTAKGYLSFFKEFQIESQGFFPFSRHRFCSFVFKK